MPSITGSVFYTNLQNVVSAPSLYVSLIIYGVMGA